MYIITFIILGCLIVFDLTKRDSFKDLHKWIADIRDEGPDDISLMIVGNKSDLVSDRQVSFKEADELAKSYKVDYIEVSAKMGINVSFMFEMMSRAMVNRCQLLEQSDNTKYSKKKEPFSRVSVDKSKKKSNKDGGCC
jgi:Ras-related protein Rab-11A